MNRPTGLWFGEVVHFADVLYKNGYKVHYISPEGGYTAIDPQSLQEDMMTDLDWKYYQNKDFMTRLGHTVTPDAVKAKIMMSFISAAVTVQFGTSKIMKIYKS